MILVVDDDDAIVTLWQTVIAEAGYFFDGATDPSVALYKMSRIYYSLALIDIMMPGMDGIELARRVKALPSPFCSIPLIAMTGGLLKNENLFKAVLHKPFLPRDLRALIKKYADPPILDLHLQQKMQKDHDAQNQT